MGVSVSRALLLLLMLIPGNLSFHISRGHEEAKKNMKKVVPSCTELLNMWHQMNRMTRHSLATNEIPILPRNFLGLLLGITHTYPETPRKHQSRSHFRKVTNTQNAYEDSVLSPFVRSPPEKAPDLLLNIGFSDPVERLYVDQREFLHQPKSKQKIMSEPEKHGFQSTPLHQVAEDQTFKDQSIVPKPADNPERLSEETPKYERAFPLNEPSDTSHLFGSFDYPFSEGFSSFSDEDNFSEAEDVLQGPGSVHHKETTGLYPNHQRMDSLFSGFHKTTPDTHLQDEVMDMFGTVLHDTEEEERWIQEGKQPKTFDPLPPWMVAGDLGSFGSFASDNEPSNDDETEFVAEFQKTGRFDTPKQDSLGLTEVHFKQPYFPQPGKDARRQEVTCVEITDRLCESDSNCACTGWMTLKCERGKCRRQDAFEVPEGFDLGTWHDGPLSHSELGMNQGRRVIRRNPWTPM